MCNFQYQKNDKAKCSLYFSDELTNAALPLDEKGLCLFHSTSLTFKVEHDVEKIMKETLEWLNENDYDSKYDFSETRMGIPGTTLKLNGFQLQKEMNFYKATFLSPVELNGWDSGNNVLIFDDVAFNDRVELNGCTFESLDFSYSKFKGFLIFQKCTITKQPLILLRCSMAHSLIARECRFLGGFSCFEAHFDGVLLEDSFFAKRVNFESAVLTRQFIVMNAVFEDAVDFVNTQFEIHDRGMNDSFAPITFHNIEVKEGAAFNFRGEKPQGLFFATVHISLKDEVCEGRLLFTNANLNHLDPATKVKVFSLVPSGHAVIGTGCLKYRHQKNKTIQIGLDNQTLVMELTNTFAKFFEGFNGMNLGVEIEEKQVDYVKFFYFSDENISASEFEERLADTETNFWQLIGQKLDTENLPEKSGGKFLYALDTLVDITSIFFKICARIPFGKVGKEDLEGLLSATQFHQRPIITSEKVQQIIVHNYHQSVLFGINNKQLISNKK